MSIIETRGLRRTFGSRKAPVEAVARVDLSVETGEIFGFLGPNGAGKTTTLRMLATLPLLLLSGVLLPLTLAPAWLRAVALADPLSYAVDAGRAVFNDHLGDVSVVKGVVIMGVLAALAIAAAARSFNRAVA